MKRNNRSLPAQDAGAPQIPTPVWSGEIKLRHVRIAAKAYPAATIRLGKYPLQQVHSTCKQRLRKQCPVHGPVPSAELTKTYTGASGRAVEIDLSKLARLRTPNDRCLQLIAFVRSGSIDQTWFCGRSYYVLPQEQSAGAYVLLRQAMAAARVGAMARVMLYGREQVVYLTATNELLLFHRLRHRDELRPADTFRDRVPDTTPDRRFSAQMQQLVCSMTRADAHPIRCADLYEQRLGELVQATLAGREPTAPPADRSPSFGTLQEALKASLRECRALTPVRTRSTPPARRPRAG